MAELNDSGARREFDTGAVRDIADGKGRCDLLPLAEVSAYLQNDDILRLIGSFIRKGDETAIYSTMDAFLNQHPNIGALAPYDPFTAILDLSIHYEDGARKYDERNWERGIPCHCFVDSGIRHYLKWRRGDKDEPHDRAFLWNMFGLLWTLHNRPDLNDLPFAEEKAGA